MGCAMTRTSDPHSSGEVVRPVTERTVPIPNGNTPGDKPARRHDPTFAHRLQYGALRGVVGLLRRIGLRSASAVGAGLGRLGYRPLAIRREVVERQLRAALPELPPDELRRIARASYAHLGRTTTETALLPLYDRERIIAMFEEVEGWSIVEERLAREKGLIIVTGHLGNWELGGAYLAARGLPIQAVARYMENPLFDRYLTRTRERIGMTIVHDDEAVRRVPRALRLGNAVAVLIDQGAVGLASTWAPFFGRLAKTPRGPAVFALRLDTPVVFGGVSRLPNGRFRFSFEPVDVPRTGVVDDDVDAIVNSYTKVLETYVRKTPEQHL